MKYVMLKNTSKFPSITTLFIFINELNECSAYALSEAEAIKDYNRRKKEDSLLVWNFHVALTPVEFIKKHVTPSEEILAIYDNIPNKESHPEFFI